ncbi:MAG TPA: ABC transporter ATP-binding protein [Candidatus Hydrogenedentes bacterium]|nr:ABC transporter ATP-binding protein [Candidatus Hydrogenedentota bacterium]
MWKTTFWRYLRYSTPYWRLILASIGCGVLKFSLALGLPASLSFVTKYVVVDDLSAKEKIVRLFIILGLLTAALAVRTPITYWRSYWASRACSLTIFDIRMDVFRHVQRLSLAFHNRRRKGNLTARIISDLNDAQGLLGDGVINVAMDSIFLCATALFLLFLDWQLAVVSLFTLPIYGIVYYRMNPKLRHAASQVQKEMEEMAGEVNEKLGAIQVVKAFVREDAEAERFRDRQMRYFDRFIARLRLRTTLTSVAEFLQSFGPLVVICFGGYHAIQDAAYLPKLILFYGFIQHLYLPTRRLADCSAVIQEKLAAVDRVFELLDAEPDIQDRPGAPALPTIEGRLVFDKVTFGYQPGNPVLRDISFAIEPGQAVAIVGRSGAGKTTLVNLVPRFYDAWSGAVFVDGHDIRNVSVKSLRRHIGMVLQDTILFAGSIRENILYGRPGATDEEMRQAARMAHVDEFVEAMPQGYDTPIGERGVTLSGGQKQRLSIARAFLCDPRILILDEATSSLDSRAESIIQDALKTLMRGRTTLVIAHRLSTVVDCDFVVVLDDGRLIEQGPHETLIRNDSLYRRLCEEQFGHVRLDAFTGALA